MWLKRTYVYSENTNFLQTKGVGIPLKGCLQPSLSSSPYLEICNYSKSHLLVFVLLHKAYKASYCHFCSHNFWHRIVHPKGTSNFSTAKSTLSLHIWIAMALQAIQRPYTANMGYLRWLKWILRDGFKVLILAEMPYSFSFSHAYFLFSKADKCCNLLGPWNLAQPDP